MLADDWPPSYPMQDITGLLSRHEAWQARAVGELEQLKQNIRHFTIEVSVLTNIFYFTLFRFFFREGLHSLDNYVLTFGFAHSCHEFIFYWKYIPFLPNKFLIKKRKVWGKKIKFKIFDTRLTTILSQKPLKSFCRTWAVKTRVGKNPGFFSKKNQPSGVFCFFLVFLVFLGFFWVFCPEEKVFRVFFQFHKYF